MKPLSKKDILLLFMIGCLAFLYFSQPAQKERFQFAKESYDYLRELQKQP